MRFSPFILLIAIFSMTLPTFAQQHQWAKPFETLKDSSYFNLNTLSVDSLDNTYVAGIYGDSLLVDSFRQGSNGDNYVAKIDYTGKTKWVSTFNSNKKCRIYSVLAVNSNRILVYAGVGFDSLGLTVKLSQIHSLTFSGTNPVKSNNNYATFVVEYDSNGNVIKTQKIYQENNGNAGNWRGLKLLKDSKNNLIVSVFKGNGISNLYTQNSNQGLQTNNVNTFGYPQFRIIKYSKNFDSIYWVKDPTENLLNNYSFWNYLNNSISVDTMDNVYFSISCHGYSVLFKGVTYNLGGSGRHKGLLFVLSSDGNVFYADFFNEFNNNNPIAGSLQRDAILDIVAIDTNEFYLICYFMDTLRILGNKYHASQVLFPDSMRGFNHHNFNLGIVKMGTSAVHWAKIAEKRVYYFDFYNSINAIGTIRKDGFGHTYACFYYSHNYDISIGGLTDSIKKPFDPYSSYAFVKFDSLGNALWIKEGIGVQDMQPNNVGELIYCGNYGGTVEFDPFTLSANYLSGFVAKLMDYSITRGPVSAGPYCAGDSIFVPFTITGEFDTANWFIAQLSDEHGNFESGFRELGRIKGNTDSVVVGTLPLFEVASSAKYRIRIRATHPAVQSFYWEDTLQLLIYSRDKADPGPQEFLCFGDSMVIQTFGGTKWEWSPNQFITDTTARKTIVFPPQTSTYRIVISDSSGCGEADTAFKTIVVRKKPQIASPQTDFIVCFNDTLQIPASFSLGDSTNYINKWYLITAQGWQLRKTGEGLLQDTFTYIASPSMPGLQRIVLVHSDQCYPENDTLEFNLFRASSGPSPAILSAQDSLFCSKTPTLLTAQLPNRPKLEWHWLNSQGDTLQSGSNATTDSLEVIPLFNQNQPETFRVVTINNCVGRRDTASITLFPREPLKVIPSTFDTLVCNGTELTLFAFGKGGDSLNYQFNWFATTDPSKGGEWILLSTEDTLKFIPSTENNSTPSTQNLKLILSDGCMPENDTVEVLINVRPKLRTAILRVPQDDSPIEDTTVCSGSELEFFAKGFGGDSSNYTFQWEATSNGGEWEVLGSDSVVTLRLSKGDNINMIRLIVNDDCSPADTSLVTINILPPLSVTLRSSKGDTVCSGEEIEFFAEPSGGNNSSYTYQWFVNDTLVSSDSTTKVTLRVPQGDNHGTQQIKLVLSDACTNPNDTFEQIIVVRPKLSVTLSGVEVCANPSSTLTANPTGGNPANYVIEWFDQDNTQIGTGETLVVTPNELTTYKVILSDGCSEPNAEAQIQIDRLPSTLTLSANPTEGCEPLEVEYTVNTNYSLGFSTIIQYGAPDSITGNNRYTYQQAGTYFPRLEFRGDGGCAATISGPEITVHPKPIADFTFVPEEPSLDKPKVNFKNLSTGAISYQWNLDPFGEFTDFEPEVSYQDSGRFSIRLIAFSDKGCSDTLEGELFVKSPERMFIPTAFSPNGDGLNDVFEPKVRGYAVAEFSIFNRWGEKIFSSQGTGWDGIYNGNPAQIGVYTYTLLLVDEKGEKLLFTGTVSLMR